MIKADFVRIVPNPIACHSLYHTPGYSVEYVVVSYSPMVDETMVFESDSNGTVINYSDLGVVDGCDYIGALESAGLFTE